MDKILEELDFAENWLSYVYKQKGSIGIDFVKVALNEVRKVVKEQRGESRQVEAISNAKRSDCSSKGN